jgi:hypothetical protein
MSPSGFQRKHGFKLLLLNNGEQLTGKDVSTKAIINRSVVKAKDALQVHDGRIDFTLKGVTEIEISRDAISKPDVGLFLTDPLGLRHRIQMVCSSDITWVVYCMVSDVKPVRNSSSILGVGGEEILGVGGEGVLG